MPASSPSKVPSKELQYPKQIEDWLEELGGKLTGPASLVLIGSGGLLWHAFQEGNNTAMPENSMDVDPITEDEEVAAICYESLIGSEFELEHGWHVNLMPREALNGLPDGWPDRALEKNYGHLKVVVPSVRDLLVPKLARGEPRDVAHAQWAVDIGLTNERPRGHKL